jgi:hypothetical protein
MKRAAFLLGPAVVAVLLAPAAGLSHPKTYIPKGYVSNISAVVPNVLGLSANVLGGDERLRLSNYSGKTVVVLGYQGEPYLRFAKSGVYVNELSPGAYLNRSRKPKGLKPGLADSEAVPRWRRVAVGASYEWYDHRIHWIKSRPPIGVRRHPDRIQRIFTWRVPGRAGGRPFAITGLLGYAPPESDADGSTGWVRSAALVGAGGVLAAGLLAAGAGARRKKRRAPELR